MMSYDVYILFQFRLQSYKNNAKVEQSSLRKDVTLLLTGDANADADTDSAKFRIMKKG